MRRKLNRELLDDLSGKYGDGFYILDSDAFERNYEKLERVFSSFYPEFGIAYSYKTNYIPQLCRIVNAHGGFAEVVSDMELEIAEKSGVKAERVIWNGPVKNKEKMHRLLIDGGTVNIDNLKEWDTVRRIAEGNPGKDLSVGIRLNFDVGDGVVSRFGFDVEGGEFEAVCKGIKETANISLTGLQCHFARRQVEYWEKRTRGLLAVYDRVVGEYGLVPQRIDLGGGIYGEMPEELAEQIGYRPPGFRAYAEVSARIAAEHFKGSKNKPMLLIEPGTAIAADSMRAVFRIENIREIRGRAIATVYGSQKNISMNGINPPMELIDGGGEQKEYDCLDFAGYTCIEGDYLYKGFRGAAAVGDYIVLGNCGSYSVVMKPPFILPNFPIIDLGGDKPELVKRAESFEDLFRTYTF